MMVTMFITSEISKVIAIEIVMIFTTIVTTRIAKIITKGWLGFVQVNGTSEERLLAQLSALQLAVSQGSTNTVMVFVQFLLIFILIYIRWWLGVFAILVIVMMMMVFTRWQRHAGTAHRLWGSRPWSSTEGADCSCSGCQFGQGAKNIWWRKYLVEEIFDGEIILEKINNWIMHLIWAGWYGEGAVEGDDEAEECDEKHQCLLCGQCKQVKHNFYLEYLETRFNIL